MLDDAATFGDLLATARWLHGGGVLLIDAANCSCAAASSPGYRPGATGA